MADWLQWLAVRVPRGIRSIFEPLPEYLRENIAYELRSLRCRANAGPLRLNPSERHYLNLGCGDEPVEGWVNVDFFDSRSASYHADLRFPLLIDDAVFDGIFSEHTLEHLTYEQAERLLAECLRVLKPGGKLRLVLPDVGLFARRYAAEDRAWFEQWEKMMFLESRDPARSARRLISPMAALSFVTQEYGHVSCWDFETLEATLTRIGFSGVERSSFGEASDPKLAIDSSSPSRVSISVYAEATR